MPRTQRPTRAHTIPSLAIPGLAALLLVTSVLIIGCGSTQGPPPPSDAAFQGPLVSIEQANAKHIVVVQAPSAGWTIERDVPRLVIGCLVILLGLLGLLSLIGRGDVRLPLGYALHTFTLGAYVVVYTHTKDVLFDAPRFWFFIWAAALPISPIGAALLHDYLKHATPRGWRCRAAAAPR